MAPRDVVGDLLRSLERAALLHVDDVHDGLAEELAQWEHREAPDTAAVDGNLAAARWILDLFQRFAPHKTGLLEDFFGSPPAVDEAEFVALVNSVDVLAYRAELEARLADYEALVAELEALRERIATLTPWADLAVELAAVGRGSYAALTPVRIPLAAVEQLEQLLTARGGHLRLAPVGAAAKVAYAVVVSLPQDLDAVGAALRQVRAEEVELPRLDSSAAAALESARNAQRRAGDAAARSWPRPSPRRPCSGAGQLQAVADEYEGRRHSLDARGRIFYSRHAAVIVGWVETTRRGALEALLAGHPQIRYRLSAPAADDRPPVKLNNRRLVEPFQTLITMYGLPSYFGIDPTPFVAVAMTVFYAIALGDFGYGVLQILLASWLRRRFQLGRRDASVSDHVRVHGGCHAGGGGPDLELLRVFSRRRRRRQVPRAAAVDQSHDRHHPPDRLCRGGWAYVFQLASITAGFVNLLKRGDRAGAICDNLAWLVLLVGGLLAIGGMFLGAPALQVVGAVLAAAGAR